METKNIVGGIVALTVVVICVATIMMPVLFDATTTEKTFTNEGLWRMSAFSDNQEWEYSDGTWTLNGEEQISGTTVTSNNSSNAVLGTDWHIRANGWIRGETISGNATNPITIVANETVTVKDGSTEVSVDYSGYGVDTDGSCIMTAYNSTSYVLGDSEIYATGQANFGSARGIVHFEGSIDDGITATIGAIKNDTYTDFELTNVTVNYEAVDGYEDLYKLTSITATASCVDSNSDTQTGTITFTSYVVPYEVTAELSQHLGTAEIALINVIPVLVIVSLVVAAGGMLVVRNRD